MLNTKVANSCFKIPLGSFPSSFHFLLTSLITKIVFKKGRCYLYHDVSILDYVIFREHSSQGKALNEYIKKYECERINDVNLEELENFKEKLFSEN